MTAPQAPVSEEAAAGACPRCGAPVRPDQDWCLSCGLAVTTHVAGAPGWRTPVAIVGVVLALAAAALVVAFLELSDDAEQEVAQAPTPAATAAPAPTDTPAPTPEPTPGATGATGATGSAEPAPDGEPSPSPSPDAGTIASWPAGRTAYTVILASETSREAAEEKARGFQASGKPIGILDSDEFESLRGGYHVVFSGQYDDQSEAQAAADALKATSPDAYVRHIVPR